MAERESERRTRKNCGVEIEIAALPETEQVRNCGVENLVEESKVGEARWVAEGESGGRGFDKVRVEVLGLVTIFEDEVLEEGICGKWVRQEVGGEEG